MMTRTTFTKFIPQTRAKKMAIILGSPEDIATMIANNREVRRNTTLFRDNTIDW